MGLAHLNLQNHLISQNWNCSKSSFIYSTDRYRRYIELIEDTQAALGYCSCVCVWCLLAMYCNGYWATRCEPYLLSTHSLAHSTALNWTKNWEIWDLRGRSVTGRQTLGKTLQTFNLYPMRQIAGTKTAWLPALAASTETPLQGVPRRPLLGLRRVSTRIGMWHEAHSQSKKKIMYEWLVPRLVNQHGKIAIP